MVLCAHSRAQRRAPININRSIGETWPGKEKSLLGGHVVVAADQGLDAVGSLCSAPVGSLCQCRGRLSGSPAGEATLGKLTSAPHFLHCKVQTIVVL